MFEKHWIWFWIVGLIVVCAWLIANHWSKEARLGRRRRKSHSRVISTTNRPSVKLSVKVPPESGKQVRK